MSEHAQSQSRDEMEALREENTRLKLKLARAETRAETKARKVDELEDEVDSLKATNIQLERKAAEQKAIKEVLNSPEVASLKAQLELVQGECDRLKAVKGKPDTFIKRLAAAYQDQIRQRDIMWQNFVDDVSDVSDDVSGEVATLRGDHYSQSTERRDGQASRAESHSRSFLTQASSNVYADLPKPPQAPRLLPRSMLASNLESSQSLMESSSPDRSCSKAESGKLNPQSMPPTELQSKPDPSQLLSESSTKAGSDVQPEKTSKPVQRGPPSSPSSSSSISPPPRPRRHLRTARLSAVTGSLSKPSPPPHKPPPSTNPLSKAPLLTGLSVAPGQIQAQGVLESHVPEPAKLTGVQNSQSQASATPGDAEIEGLDESYAEAAVEPRPEIFKMFAGFHYSNEEEEEGRNEEDEEEGLEGGKEDEKGEGKLPRRRRPRWNKKSKKRGLPRDPPAPPAKPVEQQGKPSGLDIHANLKGLTSGKQTTAATLPRSTEHADKPATPAFLLQGKGGPASQSAQFVERKKERGRPPSPLSTLSSTWGVRSPSLPHLDAVAERLSKLSTQKSQTSATVDHNKIEGLSKKYAEAAMAPPPQPRSLWDIPLSRSKEQWEKEEEEEEAEGRQSEDRGEGQRDSGRRKRKRKEQEGRTSAQFADPASKKGRVTGPVQSLWHR